MSNVLSFTGRVGRDAEVRHLPSGQCILTFAVACETGFGDKKKTLWFRVSVFGKRAEGQLVDYLKKGQQVFISGELSENEFTGNDGVAKKSLEINATIIDLIGGSPQTKAQTQPDNSIPF
jgi:single-strand DNA-binding protein